MREVNFFGLTPDFVAARTNWSAAERRLPTLKQSLLHGSIGFCLASTVVFAIVRCGHPLMYKYLGALGPYLVATVLFVLLAGGILSRLVIGPGRLARFYLLFCVAFFSYAACWVAAYFVLHGLGGELLGSVAGIFVMALVLSAAFGAKETLPRLIPAMLLVNLSAYFLGRTLFYGAIGGNLGIILFGACYGLGFGAGLGYALFLAQERIRQHLSAQSPHPAGQSPSRR